MSPYKIEKKEMESQTRNMSTQSTHTRAQREELTFVLCIAIYVSSILLTPLVCGHITIGRFVEYWTEEST